MTTSGVTAPLRIGTRLDHDGTRFEVVEIAGRRLVLRQLSTGAVRQVDLAWLLAHPTTRIAEAAAEAIPSAAVAFADLDGPAQVELEERAGHVREVLTGYQRGSAEVALPGEPRPEYAPGTAMMVRYEAKAAEIGMAVSTLRHWVRAIPGGRSDRVGQGTDRPEEPQRMGPHGRALDRHVPHRGRRARQRQPPNSGADPRGRGGPAGRGVRRGRGAGTGEDGRLPTAAGAVSGQQHVHRQHEGQAVDRGSAAGGLRPAAGDEAG